MRHDSLIYGLNIITFVGLIHFKLTVGYLHISNVALYRFQ